MWKCEVCGYLSDDSDDMCENCWAFRDANNFIDWIIQILTNFIIK